MSVHKRLKNISIFKSIKDKEELLSKIKSIITEKEFPANNYIIKEGEVGNAMYILSKGKVSIQRTTLMGDTFSLATLSEEDNVFFGELALLDDEVRSATVYTLTDTVCYMIKKDDFEQFCEEHPLTGYFLVKDIAVSLAKRLRKTTNDNLILINALCDEETS